MPWIQPRAGVAPDVERVMWAMASLAGPSATLWLEGAPREGETRSLLGRFAVHEEVPGTLHRGTIWPRLPLLAIRISKDSVVSLLKLVEHLPPPEVCTHLHVYIGLQWACSWFDCFTGSIEYSSDMPAEIHEELVAALQAHQS